MSEVKGYPEGHIFNTILPYDVYMPCTYPDTHLVFAILSSKDEDEIIYPRFYLIYKNFDPKRIDENYKILFITWNLPINLNTNFIFNDLLKALRKKFPDEHFEYLLQRLIRIKKDMLPDILNIVKDLFTSLREELKIEDFNDLKDEVQKIREELNDLKEIVKNIRDMKKPKYEEGDIIESLRPHHKGRIYKCFPKEVKLIFIFSIRFNEKLFNNDKPEEFCTPLLMNAVYVYGKFNSDKFGPYDIPIHNSPYFQTNLDTHVVFLQLISFLGTIFKEDEFQYINERYIQVKNSLITKLWEFIDEFFSKF